MSEDKQKRPKACVGVMIFKDNKILIGKRKETATHGFGEYSLPGGHIEFGESFEETAKRETKEEAGIEIKNLRFLSVANIFRHKDRQDILISFSAEWESGDVKILEPEKCDGWDWYSLDNLPSPLFYPTKITIDSHKTGKNFYDKE
jgi:8-oxo-dGTP diphosphatase